MFVTVDGMVTPVSNEHPAKAYGAMFTTLKPSISSGMARSPSNATSIAGLPRPLPRLAPPAGRTTYFHTTPFASVKDLSTPV